MGRNIVSRNVISCLETNTPLIFHKINWGFSKTTIIIYNLQFKKNCFFIIKFLGELDSGGHFKIKICLMTQWALTKLLEIKEILTLIVGIESTPLRLSQLIISRPNLRMLLLILIAKIVIQNMISYNGII